MILQRFWMCSVLGWKFFRVFLQLIYGAWRISKLSQPMISIFGSAKMAPTDKYVQQANQIAAMFVDKGMTVLTGGGPGIMQGANAGAYRPLLLEEIRSIGIGVQGLHEAKNTYVQEYFELDYFFARKWLLTQYSKGFVIFPGGFGTIDELSEVLTLIQTNQMKRVPIVLIGKEFWRPFMQWVTDEALVHGLVTSEQVKLFSVTDDPYKAFCFVMGECEID